MNKSYVPKLLTALAITSSVLLHGCKKNVEQFAAMDKEVVMAAKTSVFATQSEDFSEISWGNAKSQPTPTHEINGEVVNNKLYIFGGHDYIKRPNVWSQTKRSYVYDPVTNVWSAIADLPHLPSGTNFGGVTNEGLTNDGTFIYFAGGYICNANGTGQVFGTKQVWKYSTLTNSYEKLPDLPRALGVGQLKYLNGKLHFMGGADLSRNDVSAHYVLDLNNLTIGWKTAAPLLGAVNQAGGAVLGGKIYVVGGARGHDAAGVAQKTLQVYDETTNKWQKLADMTTARDHIASSVVVVGNRIIVLGGETSYNVTSKLVSAYTPSTNTWVELTQMPAARSGGVAALLNNNLYYSGGNFATNNYKGAPVLSGSSVVLTPTDDAYVRDGAYSTINYGRDTTLNIKGSSASGYTRLAYLKFSLAGVGAVSSARLRIYGYNADNANAIDISCYGVSGNNWTETLITAKDAPVAQQSVLSLGKADNQPKYIEFDVTGYVQNQLAANSGLVSLQLKDAAIKNTTILFNSKEALANKPQLILTSN
jgi:N-acetylneuraminic acid mutarotase